MATAVKRISPILEAILSIASEEKEKTGVGVRPFLSFHRSIDPRRSPHGLLLDYVTT